ncbi:Uncharacterised protein [Salmonella enterica subsp. arizonae]|uniref:Uncharacterized protein n=1 Tax=Salmonella enterica subsp. arizonae TaxID=59203 RepID=A0A2X4TAB1_SALER|nr:Uncharacterised protein [Salmonella enterica subsp. arizonae]SUG32841.1 Uncharacterised protein [Salmonella enterica subsp. arizonae]
MRGTLARSVMLLSRYSCPNQAPGLRPLLRGELWTPATDTPLRPCNFQSSAGSFHD